MTKLRMLIGVRLIGRLSRTAEMSPGQDQRVKDVIQRLIWSRRSFAIQLIVLVILGALDRGL